MNVQLELLQIFVLCLINMTKSAANPESNKNEDFPLVTVTDGALRGRRALTVGENKEYYSFRGIPFAKPPVGNLRFTDPVSNDKWNGTLDAGNDKSQCTQGSKPVEGSEDCLYLNVYTPSLKRTGFSVMVWIHGGAFIKGNSSYQQFGPDYLLERDIVFASFNYRLGVFGFLSTEDMSSPGNMGLKDQVLALKWIQTNIKYFGGDPNRVTIFGGSAGSASVSYLLQSNSTKGLFGAAIMQSGSSLCLWGLNRRARKTAFAIGTSLGIVTSNSTKLVDKLRQVNYTFLQTSSFEASTLVALENPLAGIRFSPVIEPQHSGAFFSGNSDELLRQGSFHRVPLLMGFNSNEGELIQDNTKILSDYLLSYDIDGEKLVPADLTNSTCSRKSAGIEIKSHYFPGRLNISNTDLLIKFVSDDQFNRPIRRMAIDTMNYTDVYLYELTYEGILGGVVNRTYKGVTHGEELGYLFRRDLPYQTPKNDSIVRANMVRLWTNFAKFHNPTPKKDALLQNVTWLKTNATSKDLLYLDIDVELKMAQNPFDKDMKFWDGIYRKYGEPPYNTY